MKYDVKEKKCVKDDECEHRKCAICKYNEAQIECLQCMRSYSISQLKKDECLKGVANCKVLDTKDTYNCRECNPGYYVTMYGKCKPNAFPISWYTCLIIIAISIIFIMICYINIQKKNEADKGSTSEQLVN